MRNGQAQWIPEIIISGVAGLLAFLFLGSFLPASTSQQSPISSTVYSQSLDQFFFTFLQTPVPPPNPRQQTCLTSFSEDSYTFSDLLSQAAALPKSERDLYLESFQCYLGLFYLATHPGYDFMNFHARITFPDTTSFIVGNEIGEQAQSPLSTYTTPALDGKHITVELFNTPFIGAVIA